MGEVALLLKIIVHKLYFNVVWIAQIKIADEVNIFMFVIFVQSFLRDKIKALITIASQNLFRMLISF